MVKKTSRPLRPLPGKKEILDFLETAPPRTGKREITRAFNIKGADNRQQLKKLLREMQDEGLIGKTSRQIHKPGALPPVGVIRIIALDDQGDLTAEPSNWDEERAPPPIRVILSKTGRPPGPPPGVGDRALAKLEKAKGDDGELLYHAHIIRRLSQPDRKIMGVLQKMPDGNLRLQPVEKKARYDYQVASKDLKGAKAGDLVMASPGPRRRDGVRTAKVTEVLGDVSAPRAISLIAIHAHSIPVEFPKPVLAEASKAKPVSKLNNREDLRALPLITIDPADARDHDDAVYAQPDDDPGNSGGHIVWVAIADVAHYVTPESALDKEAGTRGNSTYFPDRVVPMLPERISNDLCSLREGEDRPCLCVRMVFDKEGNRKTYKFVRGLMRSAAKLSYTQAQTAIDGHPDEKTKPLVEPVLKPLMRAWSTLDKARIKRAPLDLNLPEYKIKLSEDGKIQEINTPPRLAVHKLIEEFMIQANVAAAWQLEKSKTPLIYRIHDTPTPEKVRALADMLHSINLKIARGSVMKAAHFNGLLHQTRNSEFEHMISEMVLRTQAQAVYDPDNIGHFGLNLSRYAHFTSPIRRYSDLIVHRGLIRALKLGADGLRDAEIEALEDTAAHISGTERRSMLAERESTDRYMASYMADRVGAEFSARISGVARAGLFLKLSDTGADGFVPISTLGDDYFIHDERHHALIGERSGETYRIGDPVRVQLKEATPVSGGLRFVMLSSSKTGKPVKTRPRPGARKHSRARKRR